MKQIGFTVGVKRFYLMGVGSLSETSIIKIFFDSSNTHHFSHGIVEMPDQYKSVAKDEKAVKSDL
jgi:hypothetical protein